MPLGDQTPGSGRTTPPVPRSGRTIGSHFRPSPRDLSGGKARSADPLNRFIVGDRRPVLEDDAPRKTAKSEVEKWIKANFKGKSRIAKLDKIAAEIDKALESLKANKLDNLSRLVIAWGWAPSFPLSVSLLSSAPPLAPLASVRILPFLNPPSETTCSRTATILTVFY